MDGQDAEAVRQTRDAVFKSLLEQLNAPVTALPGEGANDGRRAARAGWPSDAPDLEGHMGGLNSRVDADKLGGPISLPEDFDGAAYQNWWRETGRYLAERREQSRSRPKPSENYIWNFVLKKDTGRADQRSNGRTGKKRRIFEWDRLHGEIEVYDREGKVHQGAIDPFDGRPIDRKKGHDVDTRMNLPPNDPEPKTVLLLGRA